MKYNIFYHSKSPPIDIFKREEIKACKAIINELKDDSIRLAPATFFDLPYVKLLQQKPLSLRDDGLLLCRERRIIIALPLRTTLIQCCHCEMLQYKRIYATTTYMKKRFYWPNMALDIALYINRCLCCLIDSNNKSKYYKDEGTLKTYVPLKQNEFVWLDLHGPMHDGKYILVMIDLFDHFMLLLSTKPTSLDVVTNILNGWIYKLGWIKKIGNDNGSNLTSKLNKVFLFCMEIIAKKIFEYSPWCNPSETEMRTLTKGIGINKYNGKYFENLGYIYQKLNLLQNNATKYAKYQNYLPILGIANNNLKKNHTGYTPSELRIFQPIYSSFLEMNLRLKTISDFAISKEISRYIDCGNLPRMVAVDPEPFTDAWNQEQVKERKVRIGC